MKFLHTGTFPERQPRTPRRTQLTPFMGYLRTLSERLSKRGHTVSPPTVGRVLKSLRFGLQVNVKQVEARCKNPDRAAQFDVSTAQRGRKLPGRWSTYDAAAP